MASNVHKKEFKLKKIVIPKIISGSKK